MNCPRCDGYGPKANDPWRWCGRCAKFFKDEDQLRPEWNGNIVVTVTRAEVENEAGRDVTKEEFDKVVLEMERLINRYSFQDNLCRAVGIIGDKFS